MPSPRAADDARRPARLDRRSRLVTGALAGALTLITALSGCTAGPEAEPTPTRTAAPTATPEPTPTPTTTPEPERPAAMDDPGVDGAVAAATYFLSLYPYVYNTGDLTAWKALSDPECVFCGSVIDGVEEMKAGGERQEGADSLLSAPEGTEVDPGRWFSVTADVEQSPWRVVDRSGDTVREEAGAKRYRMKFSIVRSESGWTVREVTATAIDG